MLRLYSKIYGIQSTEKPQAININQGCELQKSGISSKVGRGRDVGRVRVIVPKAWTKDVTLMVVIGSRL